MQPEILIKGLQEMQLPADSETLSRFEAFHSLLDEYNEKMDLTAVLEEEERIRRHYLDSVVFLRYFHPSRGDSLIDVGTGAGFPGIPLLLVRPDLKVTFLDAQQKRLSFIEEVLRRLHLQGETLHLRAEDAGRSPHCRERFDWAVSRAVASSAVLQELMLPLVRCGGHSVAWKGPALDEEMISAKRSAHLLGGRVAQVIHAEIPGCPQWDHRLMDTVKVTPTPKAYPRKAGTPARKPLGVTD